jgi:nitrite reductase/ring-hydroxylating ferredoxin subunit
MLRQDQIAEARKLLAHLDHRTTALADGIYRNPVTDYTNPEQAAQERALFFRQGAINIGLSALLPKPGDWMTHDYTGAPILLVRKADGSLGAFLNACRHRGARVADGRGSGDMDFRCPYHGWCYNLDGALIARPDEPSFAAAERATHGLRSLAVAEKYGMIWVAPSPEVSFEVDELLCGMGEESRLPPRHVSPLRDPRLAAEDELEAWRRYVWRDLSSAASTPGHGQPAVLQQPLHIPGIRAEPSDGCCPPDARRITRGAGRGVGCV